jgi:RND family efflux transporter MFP subunit
MKKTYLYLTAGVAVLSAFGCVNRTSQEQAKRTEAIVTDSVPVVTTEAARTQTLSDSLEITGEIIAGEDVQVGAKQSGKINAVYVKEGDTVAAGQLLASLDTSQLMSQLHQAQAQVSSAIAQMNQASSSLTQARRNAAVGPSKSAAAVRSAEAQVRSARAQLQKAQAGARPQEIAQLQANLRSAKTALDNQQKELERIQTLVNEGALAGNRLEQQQTAVASAQAQFQNATEALALGKAGARSEDIAAAQEAVNQAQAGLAQAKSQQELDPLLKDQVQGAQAQFTAAQSQVQAAQAAVAIVRQQISDMQIRAPFGGKVYGKPSQPGTVVGAGTSVLRLIGGQGIYFSGQVPASEIANVRPNLPVQITIDSLPGQTFNGRIATISPLGSSVGRLFDVRVQIDGASSSIKPGMFARGMVQVRRIANAVTVPTNAVVSRGADKFVYYVQDGKAKAAKVRTGLQQDSRIQVIGLPDGVQVIVAGQNNVQDGMKVNLSSPKDSRQAENTTQGS